MDGQVSALLSETPPLEPQPTPSPLPEPTPSPIPQVLEKSAALAAENPDAIGWLKIEGTAIDNVVMHTPDEPDKYLHIDFYGNYSNRGTLYLDEACDIWESDNLIIYGHHMQSSAMFGDLDYFASQAYWENHKFIQFDTVYEERTYEVVAASYARVLYQNEEGFRYYRFIDAEDESAFNEYVDFIAENQCYDTGVGIEYGDRLLTLSTCAYHVENGRFAVVARLVTDEDDPPAADTADEAAAGSSGGLVAIEDGPAPLAAAPGSEPAGADASVAASAVYSRQSFSTDMIFLALGLLASGTGLLSLSGAGRRKK